VARSGAIDDRSVPLLSRRTAHLASADIDEAFQSMVCRCGTHVRIKRALLAMGAANK